MDISAVLAQATVERGPAQGRFWFIEYGIKPLPSMVIIPRQHVFHDRIGGRYVEVCTFHNEFKTGEGKRDTVMVFDNIASYTVDPAGAFPKLYSFLWRAILPKIQIKWKMDNPHEGDWLQNDRREYGMWGILAYLPPGSPDYQYDPIRDARKLNTHHYGKPTIRRDWFPHISRQITLFEFAQSWLITGQ